MTTQQQTEPATMKLRTSRGTDNPIFTAAIDAAIEEWFVKAQNGMVFLYFVPRGETFRVMYDGEDCTDLALVTGEMMPRNTDRDGIRRWMRPMCGYVPFFNVQS
jgi:hypothetical protein